MRTAIVSSVIALAIVAILVAGAGDDTGPNAFVVIGIASGAVYGLVALGLVLVYKGSRVFNFAQGEFGTVAAFVVYVLIEQTQAVNIPYGAAVVVGLIAAVAMGLLMERAVVRPLMNAPRVTLLVATIAVTLTAIGVEILLFLPEAKTLQPVIPTFDAAGAPQGITLFAFNIEPQRLLIVAVLLVLAAILGWFFSKTDLGLAILATSQDAFATRVVGIGVERTSQFIWGSAALLGGIAGILYVPIGGVLAPGSMTSGVLIPAFTAAVLGGMTSLPGAFVGGIAVGVIGSLAEWASGHFTIGDTLLQNVVPGFPSVVLVAVLLLVLLARPQGLLGTEA